jgi:SAM-dependent methyltransferase
MKERLVELLACPDCAGALELEVGRRRGDEIADGRLECTGCQRGFPIAQGIPRLLPKALSEEKRRTASAFGWEWKNYVEMHPEYEDQFLDWIWPTRPEFFEDKLVLDAGCGIGRHTHYAASYGARDVVAIDLSAAIETAYHNVGDLPNVHVVQADIYHPPFRRPAAGGPFEFVYSIGVLHHLPDPRAGFESLLRFVKPGGSIFGWVYGHENNGVVHHFIDPLRKSLTARLPHPVVNAISFPMTVALTAAVKGVYRPMQHTRVFGRLPSSEYLASLARFGFRQNRSIVFDHLVAPTAFYVKREEFEAWFTENGLANIQVSWRNRNSWRGRGEKPVSRAPASRSSAPATENGSPPLPAGHHDPQSTA